MTGGVYVSGDGLNAFRSQARGDIQLDLLEQDVLARARAGELLDDPAIRRQQGVMRAVRARAAGGARMLST